MKKLVLKFALFYIMLALCKNIQAQTNTTIDLKTTLENPNCEILLDFHNSNTARIVVSQSYGISDDVSLPFEKVIATILQYIGIGVDSLNYDMTVYLDIIGTPIGAYYGIGGQTNYTGAQLNGSIVFEAENRTRYLYKFEEKMEPSKAIYKIYKPNDAPFIGLYYQKVYPEILKSFYKVYGLKPLVGALRITDNRECCFASQILDSVSVNWRETDVVKEALPLFINELNDENYHVRLAAIYALGLIKNKQALESLTLLLKSEIENASFLIGFLGYIDSNWSESETAKKIIPSLIDGLKSQNENKRKAVWDALKIITHNNFPENYSLWLDWWKRNESQ